MLRFLIPALMMVSALLVLLAGAFGDIRALPDFFSTLTSGSVKVVPVVAVSAPPVSVIPTSVPARQQTTEAPTSPPGDDKQLHQTTDTLPRQDDVEATLTRLRAQEPHTVAKASVAAPHPPTQPQSPTSAPPEPPVSLTRNVPDIGGTQMGPALSPKAALAAARDLLASGRPAEARDWLARAQTQMVLQPVTPDQPVAAGGNIAATRVGEAIQWLDRGNIVGAIQAIDMAVASVPVEPSGSTTRSDGYATAQPNQPPGYYYYGYAPR